MAGEATKTPLDDSKDRLREAKDERKIAKDHLSKAKQDLVEVRREYPEKIAAAKNTLWHARETLRTIRKDRKQLARRRRKLHRQRHRNEAARAKLDARIEKKQHAAAKMEARIREDKERLERLPREGRVRLMLCCLLKAKIAYLEWRSARTRQTTKRLKEGTGQLDESRKRIEDGQKGVENRLEDKEREEDAAIEDVKKKRKELDTLTNARRGKETEEEHRIHGAWETALKKRRAVWIAASRVSSQALKFPWQRIAVRIVTFGRWAGFAGVAGCFYAYAVSLGAIYQYFYFHSNGVDIFSYAEPIDFLAPGYSLAAFFILMTGLVTLIPLVFYHLVKLILILPLPLYAEILAAVLPHFAKWVPKTSLFVLCCTVWLLFSLLGAAWAGCIWPPSQDIVRIVTNSPFQHDVEKYVRVGSTSKYLFLKQFDEKKGQADGQTSSRKNPRLQAIMARLGTILALPQTTQAEDSGGAKSPKPETASGKSDAGILVVPLSQITCISETTGNGEGLCKSTAMVVNGATGEHVHPGYVTEDRIQRIDERTSRFEGRIMAVEQQMSGWFDTVGKGIEDISQAVSKIRDPDRAPTQFEKGVVDELGEIGVKIGALTPGGPAGYSDYIAERLLPQFISERMPCEEGREPIISDFIRFINDEPRSRCPVCPADAVTAVGSGDGNAQQDALDKFYRKKIRPKVQKIVDDFSEKSPTRWTVFGFASPDGEEVENDSLSRDRAWVIIDEMCRLQENGTLDPEIACDEEERYADTQVRYFGEWHPINGISNSRSAVIAACVPKTNG